MLERMEERGEIIDKVSEGRIMNIRLEGWRGSTKALEIEQLAMGFDDDTLFMDLNCWSGTATAWGWSGQMAPANRLLLRAILGQIAAAGRRDQDRPQHAASAITPRSTRPWTNGWSARRLNSLRDVRPLSENQAVAQLLKFAFIYEQVRQPIHTLSGGERSRLQLLCLMLTQPNLLLLDEPTNNLDIRSAEALEAALEGFEGALLIISHDRYFLDQTIDQVVELKDGKLTMYEGGYTDYLEKASYLTKTAIG